MIEQGLGREQVVQRDEPLRHAAAGRDWPRLPLRWLLLLALAAALTFLLRETLLQPPRTLSLSVNGIERVVQTRQRTVGGLLREQGLLVTERDIVYPPRGAPLDPARPVYLHFARSMTFTVDGRYGRVLTHAERVRDLMLEQGIRAAPGDLLLLDGQPVSPDALLPLLAQADGRPHGTLEVVRAVPVTVTVGEEALTFTTHARTLGEALWQQGIVLYQGDIVAPGLESRVTAGLTVQIARGHPVTIRADGHTFRTRTHATTVEELLAEHNITLRDLDLITPTLASAVTDDLAVRVTRIDHHRIVEREPIPFETHWRAISEWEIDTQGLYQQGREGLFTRETLIVYEDGQERERLLQNEYVEEAPRDHIYGYGTKIVIRTVQTPEGPRQYWRRIRMLATSYTAATSGKTRDHPAYGITRTGIRAGFGIVAVDPRVVHLRTNVYVPGYGLGYAGDTGGAIKGRRIDLGYDEWNLRLWYNTVDVYLLTPVPPLDQINYVLP